ncbi:hypothetical protein ACFPAF_00405 [Hymenobacter endophyticus]|uniref:Tetratricopeptide repeat protein n=1 Tax=Hymenobacter endophyticus TaxID=3076335 RepID=A0ABU3TBU8_9BACT|nr:hypothetical protein [Hymenobacter endophyticus]MDU0368839.1 hypothetical protein [Hymenobacter endophyticus]
MTRASLLHILDHVNGISDVEIRELEQLAAAFPYCQTAHVLLAKAAHDRGSMLAGQRLRRAATYAADRDLLRQLLESTATVAPLTAEQPVAPPVAPEPALSAPVDEVPAPNQDPTDVLEILPADSEVEASALAPATTEGLQPAAEATEALFLVALPSEPATPEITPEVAVHTFLLPELTATTPEPASSEPESELPAAAEAESAPLEAEDTSASSPVVELPDATAEDAVASPSAAPDDQLPAVAPPIRPPADAGISRFEFGLSRPELPAPTAYQLPGLEEEEDELPTLSTLPAPPVPMVTAPFRADADLGYALGAGSRLGYDLQAHDGYTLDLPLDAFFEPDALLLAHLKAHKPKPAASSFDLINRFLKAQPRIKTPTGVPLPADEQPDLSVRSINTAPAIASESLAKIMVRQGKKDKAIEIYERLMERQPEKKAYFAEQIQQLQQPSE